MNNCSFHFAFASDEKFILQLQVSVLSLLKSSVGIADTQYIHVLDCGISEISWDRVQNKLNSFAESHSVKCKVTRHLIDMTLFEKFRKWNTSKATYARLLLPEILEGVRYCVYSDCDLLFFENPWRLVDQLKMANVAVLGHRNPVGRDGSTVDEKWFLDHQVPYNKASYFCAGLIAMDLDKFRKPGVQDSMFKFLGEHADVVSADQSALNWCFRNDSALASDGWGVFPAECFGDKYDIFAIHYSGGGPWKVVSSWYEFVMYERVNDIWLSFAEKTVGGNLRQGRVSFRVKAVGWLASIVTRFVILARIRMPWVNDYIHEANDVFFHRKNLILAEQKLIRSL